MNFQFQKAMPVWVQGEETTKNLTCAFKACLPFCTGEVTFSIAASTCYRFFVNGEFIGAGPARGPHGFFRVDSFCLTSWLQPGENILAIEVAGYNVNSFCWLDQPSFLQAEVIGPDGILAATGCFGFTGAVLPDRVRKTQRYSFQRPFSESWVLNRSSNDWKMKQDPFPQEAALEIVSPKKLIHRGLPPFQFPKFFAKSVLETGTARLGDPQGSYEDQALKNVRKEMKGFPENELEVHLTDEALCLVMQAAGGAQGFPLVLPAESYGLIDFGYNKSGMPCIELTCECPAQVYLLFDEILTDGDVDFTRLNCCNVIKFDLRESGTYRLQAFEAYTMRYLKIVVLGGPAAVGEVSLREAICPVPVTAEYTCKDPVLQLIYAAAVETFRQNCTDIFMDCPSRERAGWLCDSFFTARVEYELTGKSCVEHNFLENYLLPASFDNIPEGMLPMCYPADHYDGLFIPNWAMWFVIQLNDYAENRNGDPALIEAFRAKVEALLRYFLPFENEFGLLEQLDGWVFVEWSKANDFIQGVNFPSNMLYAGTLEAAGRMYHNPEWIEKAKKVRQAIRSLSFDGTFFADHAVRSGKNLAATGDHTEVCQYYAFFFRVAMPETDPELWNILLSRLGPRRRKSGDLSDLYPSNAFIGNYLRLDILLQYGLKEQLLSEVREYFDYMAKQTGTLWENDTDYASCDHGFASYAAYLLLNAEKE